MTQARFLPFRLTALALCLAATGCKVGPNFTEPAASLGDRFQQAGQQAGDPSVATDRQTYESWWTTFRDPTLDRLVETAYRQNLTLLAAGTRVLEARANLGIAIGDFYPQQQQLTAGLNYTRLTGNDPSSTVLSGLGGFWRDSLGANAVWEIDFWGRFRRGVQSADAAYLGSIATYDQVLVTLVGDVGSTYVGIRTLQAQIAIARSNVERQKQALQIVKERFRGGATTGLDVAQSENVLAQTEAVIPQLTAQLDAGKATLRVLLGMPSQSIDALLAGAPDVPTPPEAVAIGIPADLVRRRPDIRAAELTAAAQSEQIGMALAELYPAFRLNGAFGSASSTVRGNSLGNVFSGGAIQFAFGPSFSWPILNYGQITNNVRVQDAKLQGLLVAYQNSVLQAQREVDSALAGYIQGGRQVEALRRSAKAAEEAMRIAMDQYTLGSRDYTTVLTAQQNLFTAQNNLAAAMGARANALVALYRALGGGWQLREGNDFVDDATRAQMRARTNWGRVLPPAGAPRPTPPGLPGPADRGPDIRAPQW
jgi:NodT family efflux transporter outer membrane factor (OMF) lipoprotein